MADTDETVEGEEETPKKKSKKPMLFGLVLALLLGGGGFFAVYKGLILSTSENHEVLEEDQEGPAKLPPIAFVPLDPIVISLGGSSQTRHLRFRAELEVNPAYEEDVAALVPRVLDVLNSYLRAVELRDLENPSALVNLRAQMLRRIQLVTGEGRVRDLLIMEFVLN